MAKRKKSSEPFKKIYATLVVFFAAVPDALKEHLNTEELGRISLAALAAGGGVFGVLQGVLFNTGTIFPAPADAALAAFLLTTILEVNRRLAQGAEPARPTGRRRPGH